MKPVLTGDLKAIILMDVIARVSVHVFLPYNDIFDAFRLSLKHYRFEEDERNEEGILEVLM